MMENKLWLFKVFNFFFCRRDSLILALRDQEAIVEASKFRYKQ